MGLINKVSSIKPALINSKSLTNSADKKTDLREIR